MATRRPAPRPELSLAEARRIALAAQGFAAPRPRRATREHLRRTLHALGALQIDTVNVLVRAHYLVPFSRLGPYATSALDALAWHSREFTEQWAHEAAIVPAEVWPLLRHRRDTHRVRPYTFQRFLDENPTYVARVLEEVRARGALSADELPGPEGSSRRLDQAWFGTVPRAVLEAHFGRGLLAVAGRRGNFARVFDLAERVIPAAHHAQELAHEEAQRELLRRAARAHGIGTARDLADYYRMPIAQARPRLAELCAAGELREVRVEGFREPALWHAQAALPRRIAAASLLSPFDPLVWFRPRTLRLFGFEYTLEIYTPAAKRRFGYYVLPFLLGDALVARVDLKADRRGRRLLVLSAHLEAGADAEAVAQALAAELRTLASWLGLDTVRVARRGTLAPALGAALRGGAE